MIKNIFRPCDYLDISWAQSEDDEINKQNKENAADKDKVDWVYPVIIAIFSTLIALLISHFIQVCTESCKTNFFQNDAFGIVLGFLQTLPGFYIAALAAISTFNNPDMDNPMSGSPPLDKNFNEMSRRRFLAQAFSYLTFLSICLFLFCTVIKFFFSIGILILNYYLNLVLYGISIFFLTLFFSQMILITFYCLYYLGNRIHIPNDH
ncbi:hypothetical protein E0H80_02250 [Acinetobacter sp. ANC 4779]|uniref:hypothetical protein n=1 Tax=Acinetobacter sp. ANC 4779 TaxID=2529848 RepID=UPI00103B839B|nr:hypothetical protein [Acinetobacter sp. ANC 4779]TCB52676.1 hypothetical protein E0H80_02250 [Acinetobacter sp. ANC 4779]